MIDPYAAVDWNTVHRIGSANHMHITSQKALDNGYRYGIRHFPLSNYYPSAPYDAGTRPSDFRLRQHWPARRVDGGTIDPPIDWNDIITWQEEIEAPYRSELPFTEGGPAFNRVPADILFSPNGEHHSFTNSRSHICCPGSAFTSGNFDPKGIRYGLQAHGFVIGFGGPWQAAFEGMIEQLKYPDGGGITISHPTWFSRLTDEHVLQMLDFDSRVLGLEVYNDYSGRRNWDETPGYIQPDECAPGFSLALWDRVLATGRRCWGFCVPDHSVERGTDWHGRNILLTTGFTEQECLRAYRQGRFYGCLKDNGLTIQRFRATATAVQVETSRKATIHFCTEAGRVHTVLGDRALYEFASQNEAAGDAAPGYSATRPVFVRVEVEDESGERLFMQPVIYRER